MDHSYVIGIDIGGTNFRIGTVDEDGRSEHFRKVRVKEVFFSGDPLKDLMEYVREYCKMLEDEGKMPEAAAIGFPATLDRERKVVLQAPNVAFMEKLPVVDVLEEALGIPVMIERDVSMALLYDKKKYHLPSSEVLVGCYFGTGIGNAIMVDGRILLGKNGTAGELGHIPVDGSSLLCGCGNVGCMENLAGGKYLEYLCREVYPDTKVEDLFLRFGNDPLLKQFVDRIAMAVATEINILNPDYVLIGGGVPNMKGFPQDELTKRIHLRTRKPYPEEDLQLLYTEDDEDKAVIGAAFYARERIRRNE